MKVLSQEETTAKVEAQEKLITELAEKLEALEAEKNKSIANSSQKEAARELKTPSEPVTINNKKYSFQKPRFRIQYDNEFKTFISEDELKNEALLEHIVKCNFTNILKPQ